MSSLRASGTVLLLLAALWGAGCSLFSTHTPAVTGTVVYLSNRQLPADATVVIELCELNRDGVRVRVVASETLPRPRRVPDAFSLPYRRKSIASAGYYGLEARILSGGKPVMATPWPVRVLTRGFTDSAEVVLEEVK